MGSILENIVAQQLKANGFSLNYYDSKKYGELDFVIQNGTHIDIIEVKSGSDFLRHNALDKVLAVENWNIQNAYVFCSGNVNTEGNIIYLPWYMSMFHAPEKIEHGSIFKVDISGL